jgi:transaldolase
VLPADGGDAEQILAEIGAAGVDLDDLGRRLQEDGATAFVRSWEQLLACIAAKSTPSVPAR